MGWFLGSYMLSINGGNIVWDVPLDPEDLGLISQRDLSPDLDLNLRLGSKEC